jgi:hypothetical protein
MNNSEGGIHQKAGAGQLGGCNIPASAQFTVGAVGFGPHWSNAEDAMAASIIRLECQKDEMNAEVALLREQARIMQKRILELEALQ